MKKLIIVSHPKIDISRVNKRWMEELAKYPDEFTVHHLESQYPDGKIDVAREQQLVEAHDTVILQFPLYWFSSPPMLKQWEDEVLLHGWAYGSKGDKLKGKQISLAVSVGVPAEDYTKEGKTKVTLDELFSPFRSTARYVEADFKDYFVMYEAEHLPKMDVIDKSAHDYVDFARKL